MDFILTLNLDQDLDWTAETGKDHGWFPGTRVTGVESRLKV
jgi:hypothetical protein